jgi:hypothetical protein
MSLFIQQDQITSNLKNDSETPATQGKYYPSIPNKKTSTQTYEKFGQKYRNLTPDKQTAQNITLRPDCAAAGKTE